jgi:antitoxin component of MazEF toxin-antitoxin module
LNSLKVRENDYLKLEQKDNCIIMSKSNKNKVSLKKLFQEYKGDNLSKDFEWDSPRGNEIW